MDIEDSRVLPLMLKRKFCAFVDAYHRSAVTSEHGVISQSEMCPLCLEEEAKTIPLCVNTWQETPGSTDKTGHGVCDNCLPMYLKPNPARCLICKEEYNKDDDFDGSWGIYDGPFMQFFANGLNSKDEPFFSTFFSLSSHPPYILPDSYLRELHENEKSKKKTIFI